MARIITTPTRLLRGEVRVDGSKNSILPILAATILCDGCFVLNNVPSIEDVRAMLRILEFLGAIVRWEQGSCLVIDTSKCNYKTIPSYLTERLRGSMYLLGALLAVYGKSNLGKLGGDSIGNRSIDWHIKGLQELGATTELIDNDYINISIEERLYKGVWLDWPSLGTTCNLMIFGARGVGETTICNAAQNPEVEDLACFLNKMGASVRGAGTSTIHVQGTEKLRPVQHTIMPDYLEAGTYCIATTLIGGHVRISPCYPSTLIGLLTKLRQIGANVEVKNSTITIQIETSPKSTKVITGPYPCFHTDLQPLMLSLMTKANGISIVEERVFPKRFTHVNSLKKMGAKIKLRGNMATIIGVNTLTGKSVTARDIRGGMALVIAGLSAEDITIVDNPTVIQRGYSSFERKLNVLGARISVEH